MKGIEDKWGKMNDTMKGVIEDGWNAAYGAFSDKAKDMLELSQSGSQSTLDDIVVMIQNVHSVQQRSVADFFAYLVSGTPEASQDFRKSVANGIWLAYDNTTAYDLQSIMTTMIYSQLIPWV
jgi:hypothetical protein